MTLLERLQTTGLRRKGTVKSGFRYVTAGGKKVSASDLKRIRGLAIPPAWKNVFIASNPRAHLQAVGQDARGRWQYRYDPGFLEKRQQEKYRRLQRFALALPRMRSTVQENLRRKDFGRERVMACILRILATCFLRPGSQVYAKENGSIGLATLRPKHVSVHGETVRFSFPGKSGQWQERELRDRDVARVVRGLLKAPGKEVFKFQDPSGAWVDVRRRHINAFIKEVMGETFTAKDFRTWAGTLICACCLANVKLEPKAPKKTRKRAVAAAVKQTATQLGNTPAICRSAYIYPSVLHAFNRGQVLEKSVEQLDELVARQPRGLLRSERALLKLLKAA
jgi:DNA topoisomerase I